MRPLAWTGAVIYAVLVFCSFSPLLSGSGAALGWAVGGIAAAPVVTVVSFGAPETRRAILIGLGLFVSAFLVLNAYASI